MSKPVYLSTKEGVIQRGGRSIQEEQSRDQAGVKKEPFHYRPSKELEEGGGEFSPSLSHFGGWAGGQGISIYITFVSRPARRHLSPNIYLSMSLICSILGANHFVALHWNWFNPSGWAGYSDFNSVRSLYWTLLYLRIYPSQMFTKNIFSRVGNVSSRKA